MYCIRRFESQNSKMSVCLTIQDFYLNIFSFLHYSNTVSFTRCIPSSLSLFCRRLLEGERWRRSRRWKSVEITQPVYRTIRRWECRRSQRGKLYPFSKSLAWML